MTIKTVILTVVLGVLAGLVGMGCWAVGAHLYSDHQLCDAIRAQSERQMLEAAQRLQKQQGQGQPAAATPASPAK